MKEEDIVARVGAVVREDRQAAPDPDAEKPLGDDAVDRIVSTALRVGGTAKKPEAKVLTFPRWARTYAAPIAVAAAVVLFVATRHHAGDGPELPGYAITASGEQALRGDAPKTSTLHIGKSAASRFEIVARPETSVGEAKVVAYAFAMEDSEPVAVDAKVEVSKDGAVRISGDARTLGAAKELRIVLATPASAGGFSGAAERAKTARGDERVKVLVIAIDRD
jgi:hypothetical protein